MKVAVLIVALVFVSMGCVHVSPVVAQDKLKPMLSELKKDLSISLLKLELRRKEYKELTERRDGLNRQLSELNKEYEKLRRSGKVLREKIAKARIKAKEEPPDGDEKSDD